MSRSPKKVAQTNKAGFPLAVDFDGTLQYSDMNWEGLIWLAKHRPWMCLAMVWVALFVGRGELKLWLQERAKRWGWVPLVPIDKRVLAYMQEARAAGRPVEVVTGSATQLVRAVLEKANLDFPVKGTEHGKTNLVKDAKASALVAQYGEKGFDYIGNSRDDLAVWKHARHALVANARPSTLEKAKALGNVEKVFPREAHPLRALVKAMRPHQWLKNLLVFLPLVTGHMWGSVMAWSMSLLALAAFCLCASGIYLVNDLLDVQDDRAHATKNRRPFAAGTLPIPDGLVIAPVLVLLGLVLGFAASPWLAAVLVGYVVLTFSYSWGLKHMPLVDVVTLSALYAVRMLGGGAATGIPLTYWLGMFAFLIFYSLALLKRFVELKHLPVRQPGKVRARGYHVDDAALVAMLGIGAGLLSVMVVGLYINSPAVTLLYAHPDWLGVLCPILVLQLGRMWLAANRGEMHDDPVIFCAEDPVTWAMGFLALAVMVVAA